jgi:hypothetical protein
MEIYNVGQDELSEYDLQEVVKEKYLWLVYWYENDGYDGNGEAVALGVDGMLYRTGLSHCSCYGPMEAFGGATPITKKEFFRDKDDIFDYDARMEVKEKVRELLG